MNHNDPPQSMIDIAIRSAMRSGCRKSQRGVVIFRVDSAVAAGCNSPPYGFACDGSAACREHCNKLCIHAEVDALTDFRINGLIEGSVRGGYELLHVKVTDGKAVPSGPPSCWQCSREIVDDNDITHVWLLHDMGWRRYSTVEFHELTLRHNGLPVIKEGR